MSSRFRLSQKVATLSDIGRRVNWHNSFLDGRGIAIFGSPRSKETFKQFFDSSVVDSFPPDVEFVDDEATGYIRKENRGLHIFEQA